MSREQRREAVRGIVLDKTPGMFVSTATAGEIADAVMELFDAVLGEQEATPECTGIAATWCPIHGDCTCRPHGDGMADHKDDPTCPLHAPSSPHGEPVGEQEATPPEPCRKCGYVAGCMEPWEVGDGTLIDCGTCPACAASAPQGEPEPPTWQQAEDVYGFDAMREPLRAAAPDRCDECGGLVKGFFANFLRRCPNDWHIVREEWEHGLGLAPQGEGNTDE